MKRIRIKNDIRVSWGITTNGKQVSLSDKSLQVQLVVFNKVIDIKTFFVSGNVITFTFPGADQKYCGIYTLVCRDTTNGNLNTIDKTMAFELVPHTEEECGTNNANVALEVVTLNTDRDSSTIAKAATVSIGEVKTLSAGSQAYVTNTGTSSDAVLNFGIPSGGNGTSGIGREILPDPTFVTFSVDSSGNISSSQDTLVRMKAYANGEFKGYAEILTMRLGPQDGLSGLPDTEDDGCSFYMRGKYLKSTTTTDFDGNTISIPVTAAQLQVGCKFPDTEVTYTVYLKVFVNTQAFYSSLVDNQRGIKQTYTEINNSLDEQGVKMEKYYSEWQQTARSLSYTISQNKQETDGSIEQISNKLTATANSLTSTIEANKKAADESIEKTKTEFKQTTDEISATVTANKEAADGSVEKLKTEFKQTTDGISSTVEANKKSADGSIESLSSKIKQNADNITIANNRFNADGSLKNTSGLLTTADKTQLASREYVDGKVVNEATITTMIQNGISSASIKADQIDLSSGTMNFKTGELTITSDGFTLDKDGNVKFTGVVEASMLRLKENTTYPDINGAFLNSGGTLPELQDGTCVTFKAGRLFATRSSPNIKLTAGSSKVSIFDARSSNGTVDSSKPLSSLELDLTGMYDVTGIKDTTNGITYWVVR